MESDLPKKRKGSSEMMNLIQKWTVFVMLILFTIEHVKAGVIKVDFTSAVTRVQDAPILGITPIVGDLITGYIIYDTNAADTSPSPFFGSYYGGQASLSLNGTVITSSSSPNQQISPFQNTFDFYDGTANVGNPISVNGIPTSNGYFNLRFWLENRPADDTLPNPFPKVRDYDAIELQIVQENSSFSFGVIYSNTLISVSSSVLNPVPEPSTLAIFGIGAGIAGLKARRRKQTI